MSGRGKVTVSRRFAPGRPGIARLEWMQQNCPDVDRMKGMTPEMKKKIETFQRRKDGGKDCLCHAYVTPTDGSFPRRCRNMAIRGNLFCKAHQSGRMRARASELNAPRYDTAFREYGPNYDARIEEQEKEQGRRRKRYKPAPDYDDEPEEEPCRYRPRVNF